MLKEDPAESTRDILLIISNQLAHVANSSAPSTAAATPVQPSRPETWITRVNASFAASLALSLVAVLLTMLSKQWIREYSRALAGVASEEEQAKRRQFRYRGLERWKMAQLLSTIPTLIHISLLIFFCGLSDLLFHFHRAVAITAATIFALGAFLYMLFALLAAYFTECPYKSPLSDAVYDTVALIRRPFMGPEAKRSEISIVQTDPSLLWHSLKWLVDVPDFHLTPTTLEMVIATAVPSIAIATPSEQQMKQDAPWIPVLTDLAQCYRHPPTISDIMERNILSRSLAQLFIRETTDPELSPELREFHSLQSMIDERGASASQRRAVELWKAWNAMWGIGFSNWSYGLWSSFDWENGNISSFGEHTMFILMSINLRWIGKMMVMNRLHSMDHYGRFFFYTGTPDLPALPWDAELPPVDFGCPLSPRTIRLSLELAHAFITGKPKAQTLSHAIRNSIEKIRESTKDQQKREVDISVRIMDMSLRTVFRLLAQEDQSVFPELLDHIIMLSSGGFQSELSLTHSMKMLYWLWNRHPAFTEPRAFPYTYTNKDKDTDERRYRVARPYGEIARHFLETFLYLASTNRPPNRDQPWDFGGGGVDNTAWPPLDGGEYFDRVRLKLLLSGIEAGWLSNISNFDSIQEQLRHHLLFQMPEGENDVGLFHSWVFSPFDKLRPADKEACLGLCIAADIKDALRSRWHLNEITVEPKPLLPVESHLDAHNGINPTMNGNVTPIRDDITHAQVGPEQGGEEQSLVKSSRVVTE